MISIIMNISRNVAEGETWAFHGWNGFGYPWWYSYLQSSVGFKPAIHGLSEIGKSKIHVGVKEKQKEKNKADVQIWISNIVT